MSREQHPPSRRQFMRPLSLVQDNGPVTSSETSVPVSQTVQEEQADVAKITTHPIPAVGLPGRLVYQLSPSLSSSPKGAEAQPQAGQSNTTSAVPIASDGGVMPQGRQHTSGLFAGQPNVVLPQKESISADDRSLLQTARQPAMPVVPTSSTWAMPQGRPHTSGLLAGQPNAVLPQKEPTSAAWVMPQTVQQFPAAPQVTPISSAWVAPQSGQNVTLFQVAQMTPPQLMPQAEKSLITPPVQKQPKSLRKRVPLWFAVCSVIVVIMVVLTQGNGTVGAWAADTFRSIVGPVATAQIEAWYLNAQNKVQQWQFQASGQQVSSPWKLTPTAARPSPTPTPPAWSTLKPLPLTPMQPFLSPPLDGEGSWNVLEQARAPYSYLPLNARAFIRPDPAFPYAIVTLLQFDTRFSRLHIVSGTQEPGGPLGTHGAGVITQADREGNTLLAALNGGFKYADGAYGLMTDGKVYVPPQPKAATIAITHEGKLILGAWGVDPQLRSDNKDLVAWRQNASLLIDNGAINPLTKDGAAWGGTILNSEYTWRSGLGITAQGNLVYAAGNALVPETLGRALLAAGAVRAMETDINPFWVRAFLYQQGSAGKLTITKLNPQMQGTGYEYLNVDQRDFFYLTRYAPPVDGGATPTPTATQTTGNTTGKHASP